LTEAGGEAVTCLAGGEGGVFVSLCDWDGAVCCSSEEEDDVGGWLAFALCLFASVLAVIDDVEDDEEEDKEDTD
jgi:hypothetical protein